MGIRNRLKEIKNQRLSTLFRNRPAGIDAANAQQGKGHQDSLDPDAPLDSNGSKASHVHANETVERTDAPPAQFTPQALDGVSIRELWNVAWENLQQEDHKLVAEYELKLQGSVVAGLSQILESKSNVRERMSAILASRMEEVNRHATKFTLGNSEVKIKDAGELILSVVSSANGYVTQAVSANPYASIAWAGVSFLLPLFMNISAQSASLAKGLDYISRLISQSQMREEFYIKFYESRTSTPEALQQSHRAYKATLERLYRQILKFQAKICCYYSINSASRHSLDAIKWNDWDRLVNDVRERDAHFIEVERTWQYYEDRLATDTMQRTALDSLSAIRSDMAASHKTTENAMTKKEREELLSWLCSTAPSSIYNTMRDRHESGTNEWLIKDSNKFKIWETNAGSLLWLHGKAGSGKSVISSSVIRYLKDQYDSKPSTALAYFYFSFSDTGKQKVDVMLASLIKQICVRRASIPKLVERLGDYKTKGERPDNKTLEAALMASMSGLSAAYIVIDGLDECPLFNGQRELLLKSLHNILSDKCLENLHIFFTSRKEPDIDCKIRALLYWPLRSEIDLLTHRQSVNRDIRLYVDLTLATDRFKSWPVNIKEQAKQLLSEKADCMFQYVRLQLDTLQKLSSITEINKALQTLPIGLDATYNRVLESIDIQFQAQVINSLKWLTFSKRLLTPEELCEIFIIDPDKDVPFDENARLFSPSDILKYFSGLIIIEKGHGFFEDHEKVRLVHFSVKEYLTSHRIGQGSFSAFSFTDVNAHTHIALSCLAYFQHLNAKFERSNKNIVLGTGSYHLLDYMISYWETHLEEVSCALWPAKVVPSVALALADHSPSLSLSLGYQDKIRNTSREDFLRNPHCYIAYRGFRQLTEMIISQKQGANKYITQEDLDFGLYFAAYGGHLDIVRMFFEKGANMNAHCGKWKSAVHAAVCGRHINILKFFLKKGADFNSQPSLLADISSEIRRGTKCLVYLLDHGMNIDLQDENCGTALHKAIADDWYHTGKDVNDGHIGILLERGANVNALSDKLGTPLQAACAELDRVEGLDRRLLLIEKLFEYGADPNICGGPYATALQAACYAPHRENRGDRWRKIAELPMKVMQLLIDHGADVNIQGGKWGSALHAAAVTEYPEEHILKMMELLLDNGAKVDQQGGDNQGTALHVACHEGTIDAVRLLLDRGADVNAEGGRFGTPLMAAAARTDSMSSAFLTLLISKGANINPQGGHVGSALYALQRVHVFRGPSKAESVRLLLEHGANLNANGGEYGTALIAACESNFWDEECIQWLLDHGADVNAHSEEYGTALIVACQRHWRKKFGFTQRDAKVVQWLLDRGAEVNTQGGEHGTALSAACSWGHSEAVQLLLDHGADIHLQNCAAWHTAACYLANSSGVDYKYRADADALELLLKRGMDIDHVHAEHGTALHAMMRTNRAGKNWRHGMDFLLKHDINPNITNEHLGSALHLACAIKRKHDTHVSKNKTAHCQTFNCSSKKTEYLLEHCPNIDVNAQGGIFGSALQAAAYSGQVLSVRLLLERKATVNVRSGKYRTALNGAIISGNWDIVKILLGAGATPDCHLQEQPDEEWLQVVLEEDGRGAVERYRKFWEVERMVKEEGGQGLN